MTPYYETELGKIYHGDCLEIMPQLEPVDLAVTSPPYNLGNNHHREGKKHNPYEDNKNENDYQSWQKNILNLIYHKSKDCFYNHKNRIKNGIQISPYEWITKTKWTIKQEIVWINGGPNHDKIRFYPKSERIYWLSNSDTKLSNRRYWDVLNLKTQSNKLDGTEHTRAFSMDLPLTILEVMPFVKSVIDPFLGSGTTAIACERLNRRWIGIEIEEKYCEIAAKRIENESQQLKLQFSIRTALSV